MEEFNKTNIQRLLSETGSIINKYEAIARETGSNFNIFEVADISSKETVICRVLCELLSPAGWHGQGSKYLEIFLRDCLKETINRDILDNARVYSEQIIDKGRRIDIVIEAGNRYIPIEVKIYAGEQKDQCADYYNFAKSKDKQAKVVYLTRFGDAPSGYSVKDIAEDEIINISFSHDVIGWLEKCLSQPDTIKKAPIREIIIQFIAAIKHFTDQLEDKPMKEIVELLSDSSQNMRNAKAISDTIESCRVEMRKKFFYAFHEKFNNILGRGKTDADFDYVLDSKYPSIHYIIKTDAETGISLMFGLETEANKPLFAGFTMLKNGEQFADKEVSQKLQKHFDNIEGAKSSPYWIFYENIMIYGNTLNLMDFKSNNDNYFKLFDSDKFDEIVDSTVEQARAILSKLKNYE